MKNEKKEGNEKKGKEVIIAWNSQKIQHADGRLNNNGLYSHISVAHVTINSKCKASKLKYGREKSETENQI